MLCHRILLIVPPTVIIEITLTTFKQLHILFKTLLLWFGEKRNMVFGPQSVFTTIFLKFLNFSYPHEKVYFGTNWTHQKSMKLPQKTDLHRKLWRKVHGFILFHEGSQGPPTAGRYPHEKVWTDGELFHGYLWGDRDWGVITRGQERLRWDQFCSWIGMRARLLHGYPWVAGITTDLPKCHRGPGKKVSKLTEKGPQALFRSFSEQNACRRTIFDWFWPFNKNFKVIFAVRRPRKGPQAGKQRSAVGTCTKWGI